MGLLLLVGDILDPPVPDPVPVPPPEAAPPADAAAVIDGGVLVLIAGGLEIGRASCRERVSSKV